jgi:hypothetical protein
MRAASPNALRTARVRASCGIGADIDRTRVAERSERVKTRDACG